MPGQAITFRVGMPAGKGTFLLNGGSTGSRHLVMAAAVRSYALTGQAMTPRVGMPATVRTFTLTRNGATLTPGSALVPLITDISSYPPPAAGTRPGYLVNQIRAPFNVPVMRVTGDPGTQIGSFSGALWGDIARYQYFKHSTWNCDQTLFYLEHNSGGGAYSGNIFLNGSTYVPEILNSRPSGWYEARWHETNPNLMIYVTHTAINYYNVRTNTVIPIRDFSGTYSDMTIGIGEGEASWDSDIFPIQALKTSTGKRVCFAFKISTNTILREIIINGDVGGEATITDAGVSISPLGNYLVLNRDNETFGIYSIATGALVATTTTTGKPSHFSYAVEGGIEYAVGGDRSASGDVIKLRLNNGSATIINSHSFTYFTSCRSHGAGTAWVSTDYAPDSDNANHIYVDEAVIVAMNGGGVARICHIHQRNDAGYDYESHTTIAPLGKQICFQSSWGSTTDPVATFVADFSDRTFPGVF